MPVSPLLFAAIAGGAGGGIANIALSPANSGASLLNSYWYGAGLILGERDMYTFHWEKIKKRLENGEDYLTVLESEMNPAITAISAYSLEIMEKTGELYKKAGVNFLTDLIEGLLNPFFSGDRTEQDETLTDDQGLFSYTFSQIGNWSDEFLEKNFVSQHSSPQLYTNATRLLIIQEHEKRKQEVITEPDVPPQETIPIDTTCPIGQVWDPVTLKCIPETAASTIPWMSLTNVAPQAHGRITKSDATSTKWILSTNPQRNGSYQAKGAYGTYATAQKAALLNWPQTEYQAARFVTFGTTFTEEYYILKSTITIQNFPHP